MTGRDHEIRAHVIPRVHLPTVSYMKLESANCLISFTTSPLGYWRTWRARRPRFIFWFRIFFLSVFLLALISIFTTQAHLFFHANWVILAGVLALGVPASIFGRSLQFLLIARALNVPHTLTTSWHVVVAVSIANLLPLPGGIAIRVAALKTEESRYSRITSLNVLVSGLPVSLAFLATGFALFDEPRWSAPLLLFGTLGFLLVTGGFLIFRVSRLTVIYLALLQGIGFAVDVVRILLCATAFGVILSLEQATLLSVANVIASLSAVAPGGFGIREVTAMSLAHLVALDPSLAFVLSSANGLIGAAFLLLHLGVTTVAEPFAAFIARYKVDRDAS
jgi:hypothetical protein